MLVPSFRRGGPLWLAVLLASAFGASGCSDAEPAVRPGSEMGETTLDGTRFVDVTESAGLSAFRHETGAFGKKWLPETMGAGGGFLDFDGDGWQDIVLVAGSLWPGRGRAPRPALELYRNEGDGSFIRVTEAAGLGDARDYGFGVTVADYDNDGDPDLFLTTLARNRLYRNEGGRFVEVGEQAGLSNEVEWSTSALFFDADNDGWLDLYVGNYIYWSPETDIWCTVDGQTKAYCSPRDYVGTPGRFYRNNGDGTFTDRTEAAGLVDSPGMTLAVGELDVDADGWADLVVVNDTQRNLLYLNDGDGTFTERGVLSGVAFDENGRARAGMGVDVGVVDATGEPTIFIGNYSNEMVGVYRHLRDGLFTDRAAGSGIGRPSLLSLTFAVKLEDVDLDQDLDLFVVNGHITEEIESIQSAITYRQPVQLFVNDGDGGFHDAKDAYGQVFEKRLVGRGLASADYDRDGDVDVLVTENGGPVHLWRNEANPQDRPDLHYLRVRVVGQESNRDGLGARIVAVAGGRRQERRIRAGSSYLSHSETVAAFGLGPAARVDSLLVRWPGGREEVFTDLEADQEIVLREGSPPMAGGAQVMPP